MGRGRSDNAALADEMLNDPERLCKLVGNNGCQGEKPHPCSVGQSWAASGPAASASQEGLMSGSPNPTRQRARDSL